VSTHEAPPGWVLETRKTRAYGLWEAKLTDPEQREFTGSGITEWRALSVARKKAGLAEK
jgi:hypothetical protein